MLHFFKLLVLLINIDQETVLYWFGLSNLQDQNDYPQESADNYTINFSDVPVKSISAPALSLDTLILVAKGLLKKVDNGLTLVDIENIIFIVLFVRFVILSVKYNVKTSFLITCIGGIAGYLWYRHLIDVISMYKMVILRVPGVNGLILEGIDLRSTDSEVTLGELGFDEDIHWYNFGKLLYYSFSKGIMGIDLKTGSRTYIDPLSMIISNLKDSSKNKILPLYYTIYNEFLPNVFGILSQFWSQFSGIAAYALITRIGKRYCPYLIRWHWTFLLIFGIVEQIAVFFVYRLYYFQTYVILPQLLESDQSFVVNELIKVNAVFNLVLIVKDICVSVMSFDMSVISETVSGYLNFDLVRQFNILEQLIGSTVLLHVLGTIHGLFHAVLGQYFYIMVLVPNTELHVGLRPKSSIYSGGGTKWQDGKKNTWFRFFLNKIIGMFIFENFIKRLWNKKG